MSSERDLYRLLNLDKLGLAESTEVVLFVEARSTREDGASGAGVGTGGSLGALLKRLPPLFLRRLENMEEVNPCFVVVPGEFFKLLKKLAFGEDFPTIDGSVAFGGGALPVESFLLNRDDNDVLAGLGSSVVGRDGGGSSGTFGDSSVASKLVVGMDGGEPNSGGGAATGVSGGELGIGGGASLGIGGGPSPGTGGGLSGGTVGGLSLSSLSSLSSSAMRAETLKSLIREMDERGLTMPRLPVDTMLSLFCAALASAMR